MKSGIMIVVTGVIMVLGGLIMFYAIHSTQIEPFLRTIRHIGTFIGLLGIGVTLAGILLYLINRGQSQIQKNSDV